MAASLAAADPESMDSLACCTAVARSGAAPATRMPAAAFIRTISRLGPLAPPRISWVMAALAKRSPPRSASREARGRPKSDGCQNSFFTSPCSTCQTVVDPERVISSRPSEPWTRN